MAAADDQAAARQRRTSKVGLAAVVRPTEAKDHEEASGRMAPWKVRLSLNVLGFCRPTASKSSELLPNSTFSLSTLSTVTGPSIRDENFTLRSAAVGAEAARRLGGEAARR
jgi:hypothetical protein